MFQRVCQIFSLALIAGALMIGLSLTLASQELEAQDLGAHESPDLTPLERLIWAVAGYFPRGAQLAPQVSLQIGLDRLDLAFSDLSGWPESLILTKASGERLSDARPFGAKNLKGTTQTKWLETLASVLTLLEKKPKLNQPRLETLEPGLEMAKARANFGLRLGSPEITLFRVDPQIWSLRPYHEAEVSFPASEPANIQGWSQRWPKSPLILNGGQYYPDRRSMGYLKRSGRLLEGRIHKSWRGYLVQDGPKPGLYDALEPKDPQFKSQTICQSFMILGPDLKPRVRASQLLASRAFLGQDQEGFLWIGLTTGATTLRDLATLARSLGLAMALGLDGGLETQWSVAGQNYFGEYSHNALGNFWAGPWPAKGLSPTLPVVLALEKRELPPK